MASGSYWVEPHFPSWVKDTVSGLPVSLKLLSEIATGRAASLHPRSSSTNMHCRSSPGSFGSLNCLSWDFKRCAIDCTSPCLYLLCLQFLSTSDFLRLSEWKHFMKQFLLPFWWLHLTTKCCFIFYSLPNGRYMTLVAVVTWIRGWALVKTKHQNFWNVPLWHQGLYHLNMHFLTSFSH